MKPDVARYLDAYEAIPGWLALEDFLILDRLLGRGTGNILEIGAYKGASAILLGHYLAADENFTVCDLFGGSADTANAAEVNREYSDLTRQEFERNYLAWHPKLPTIVQEPSKVLVDRMEPRSCRLIHIDGSHLYEHVVADLATVDQTLAPAGVAVFDDWRSKHTPGVHFAVMEAVVRGSLHVAAITESKLYATGDSQTAGVLRDDLANWAATDGRLHVDVQEVREMQLPRISRAESAERPITFRQRVARRVAGR